MAAVTNNKPYGEDMIRNHAILHRISWLKDRQVRTNQATTRSAQDQSLRERSAQA